jgi:hypothetical protein
MMALTIVKESSRTIIAVHKAAQLQSRGIATYAQLPAQFINAFKSKASSAI